MKKILFLLATIPAFLFAETAAKEAAPAPTAPDMNKVSEAMGHLIGKNLKELGLKLDANLILKGIADAAQGKDSPMTEEECAIAIAEIQEKLLQEEAQKNLELANKFLKDNGKTSGIVELVPGKLQYTIEKKGEGPAVQAHDNPLVRYKGRYLDGTVFGSSLEPEVVSLDDSIEGFSKGIIGMKEGEKRVLYIHPDLGYKTSGFLAPNSLLTFEVEVIKSQASSTEQDNIPALKKITEELSSPLLEDEHKAL